MMRRGRCRCSPVSRWCCGPKPACRVSRSRRPDRQRWKWNAATGPNSFFSDTEQLGVYQVQRDDGGLRHFAVNLLDANESNIEPRAEIRIGSERIVAGQEISQPRDLWKWILVLAVVLLMVEWYIYNKRVSL